MSPANAILVALVGTVWLFFHLRRRQGGRRLPPGPLAFPVIGNLHLVGKLPHRNLYRLAQKYGPIMSMRLGQVPTIVVSSPETAELVLKTHDVVLSSRPKSVVAQHFHYGTKGLILTGYGSYWRSVRRLSTVKLLNSVKIESFAEMRQRDAAAMIGWLRDAANAREVVDLSEKVAEVIEGMVCKMVLGRSREDRLPFKDIFQETTQLAGAFNVGEFVPYLLPLDLQGITRRIKTTSKMLDELMETILDEHTRAASDESTRPNGDGDFMDVLLSLMHTPINSDGEKLYLMERTNIKAILVDLLGAAMDTSASTIEWVISEIIRHPRVMKKLQAELDTVLGSKRTATEEDLGKFPYLNMVMKEAMRLHPVAPLLIPHESTEDVVINGYEVPKNTRILVNVFAIGRDTKAWPEKTNEFVPERFDGSSVDVHGRDFQLLPFGSGRRGCPGIRLGQIFVKLVVAQLVHCFDWELQDKTKPEELDMSEQFGLGMHRVNHLRVVPTYRLKC